ncbi:Transmembrane protein 19 [Allomyces javanicus]|nr:Transmembrane protein 19 [Allomyces javanicus]
MHPVPATFSALVLAAHGWRKKSLSGSGAIAAATVGFATMGHPDPVFPAVLIAFYLAGSRVTKVGKRRKAQIEEEYHEAGNRNAVQVLCNGLTGTLATVLHHYVLVTAADGQVSGADAALFDRALTLAVLGHYACCAGDTFASELGTALAGWSRAPVLITTWRRVPPGTNGGITPAGTAASFLGGAVVGATAAAVAWFAPGTLWVHAVPAWQLVAMGGAIGLLGSMVDSVLGATLQATWCDPDTKQIRKRGGNGAVRVAGPAGRWAVLNNDAVNFVASLVTAGIAAWIGTRWAR